MVIGLAMFKQFPGRHPLWFVVLYVFLFAAWITFAAINAVKIQMRINELKRIKPL